MDGVPFGETRNEYPKPENAWSAQDSCVNCLASYTLSYDIYIYAYRVLLALREVLIGDSDECCHHGFCHLHAYHHV